MLELFFRRQFWVVHALGLGVVAFLLAATVNHGVGYFIQQKFAAEDGAKKKPTFSSNAGGTTRNFLTASEENIFDGKREVVVAGEAKGPHVCRTNKDCLDGMLCMPSDMPNPDGTETPVKVCQDDSEVEAGDVDCTDAPVSALPLQLIGTSVFLGYPEDSLASIVDQNKGKSADAEVYSINACEELHEVPEGDVEHENNFLAKQSPCNMLPGEHKIVQVLQDAVCIMNAEENHYELITLEEPPDAPKIARAPVSKSTKKSSKNAVTDEIAEGISKTGANSYEVKQESVNKALGSLSQLATQARIVPAFEGGEAIGFKLFSIRPGSLYSKIGIQNGDVIQKVNGYDLNSPDKALELYQKLKDGKEFSVDIKRRGKPVTFDYRISQ